MIFRTSACDLPQKEQRVRRADFAIVQRWENDRWCRGETAVAQSTSNGHAGWNRSSGGHLGHSLDLAGRADDVIDEAILFGLRSAQIIIAIRVFSMTSGVFPV